MRTTQKEVNTLFESLCAALGRKPSNNYDDKGSWGLEYIDCYGGYTIIERLESGGEGQPFGSRRRSASEMADVLRFALRAIQIDRDPKQESAQYYASSKEA